MVSGLYKPDPGTIRLAGQSFGRIRSDRLARLGVARTFQNLALFGGLSVRDNVSSGLTHIRRAGRPPAAPERQPVHHRLDSARPVAGVG
ncbi:hypothetical protein [Methylobacterium nodulans]|uniref:hypothetical protein n=1 Tax=Methylobacterium nodulans TaxID=114616 RepID=UPI0031384050